MILPKLNHPSILSVEPFIPDDWETIAGNKVFPKEVNAPWYAAQVRAYAALAEESLDAWRITYQGQAGRVTGLGNQNVEIAMMVTPDGNSRLELSRFIAPAVVADHRNAPVNALGYLRVMFTVADIDDAIRRLQKIGATLVGEVVNYEDIYRLCYVRGPEGILVGLAEQLTEKRNPL